MNTNANANNANGQTASFSGIPIHRVSGTQTLTTAQRRGITLLPVKATPTAPHYSPDGGSPMHSPSRAFSLRSHSNDMSPSIDRSARRWNPNSICIKSKRLVLGGSRFIVSSRTAMAGVKKGRMNQTCGSSPKRTRAISNFGLGTVWGKIKGAGLILKNVPVLETDRVQWRKKMGRGEEDVGMGLISPSGEESLHEQPMSYVTNNADMDIGRPITTASEVAVSVDSTLVGQFAYIPSHPLPSDDDDPFRTPLGSASIIACSDHDVDMGPPPSPLSSVANILEHSWRRRHEDDSTCKVDFSRRKVGKVLGDGASSEFTRMQLAKLGGGGARLIDEFTL